MKTQKKSMKKKALLSSLSMLMVATVAVGSATFAWFTQNPTATASGLEMRADAANGLKILTESHKALVGDAGFGSTDYLNHNGSTSAPGTSTDELMMTPASYTFTSTPSFAVNGPFTTVAAADNQYDADGKAAVTKATEAYNNTGKVYKEKIFCKLVGNSDANAKAAMKLTNLAVNFTTPDPSNKDKAKIEALQKAVRVLVTYNDGTNNKIVGAYAKEAHTNEKSLNGEISEWVATTGEDKGYAHVAESKVSYNVFPNSAVTIGNVDGSGDNYVTVYIYLDGEDENCVTSNIAAGLLIDSVEVELSIAE